MIANIKEKCKLYMRNIVHLAAKPPRESSAKCKAFRGFSTVFALPSVGGNSPYYCKKSSFSQAFGKAFANDF